MKPNLVLLGAPGSGKGTQAKRLVDGMSYAHVSTGDLLRAEIAKGSDLGNKVSDIMKAGNLVDDQTVLELLAANCDLKSSSYIFDGFPRNLEQAKMLDEALIKDSAAVALFFKIDPNVLVERIVNRRVAKQSGEIYNLITRPPKVEGKCDVSGEDLIHRPDDQEDVVRNRMKVFTDEIEPMLAYYREKGILKEVDATKGLDEIYSELETLINS